jgi:acyl-CoA dehydrogenase
MTAVDTDRAPTLAALRAEVRAFLGVQRAAGAFVPRCDAWHAGWDESFTRAVAAQGWVGMTLPARFGGGGRSPVERHVVAEELLAAGAPVAAHWAADRQMGPSILALGTEAQRERFLPAITRGEYYFAIGMSEPDAGSDLASVRTRANRVDGGWTVSGTKLWVTGGHCAHALMLLARSSPLDKEHRHAGLTQFIVLLDAPGITIRPILSLTGAHTFNEIVLEEVFVPDDLVLGSVGDGWRQVTSELAFERSGPERYLSTYALLEHVARQVRGEGTQAHLVEVGRVLSRLWSLRQLSLDVARTLASGGAAEIPAALVKDAGTRFESEVIALARDVLNVEPDPRSPDLGARLLAEAVLHAPGFTIRGGTNEILRGVVARGLGMR